MVLLVDSAKYTFLFDFLQNLIDFLTVFAMLMVKSTSPLHNNCTNTLHCSKNEVGTVCHSTASTWMVLNHGPKYYSPLTLPAELICYLSMTRNRYIKTKEDEATFHHRLPHTVIRVKGKLQQPPVRWSLGELRRKTEIRAAGNT